MTALKLKTRKLENKAFNDSDDTSDYFRKDMTALNLKNRKLENKAFKDFNDFDDTSDDCFETQESEVGKLSFQRFQ